MGSSDGVYSHVMSLGALASLLALLIRWPMWTIVGSTRPYLTFYPAIILSGWYCGFGPGVATSVLQYALRALCEWTRPS